MNPNAVRWGGLKRRRRAEGGRTFRHAQGGLAAGCPGADHVGGRTSGVARLRRASSHARVRGGLRSASGPMPARPGRSCGISTAARNTGATRDAAPATMPTVPQTIAPQQPRLQAPGQQPRSAPAARSEAVGRPVAAWRRGVARSFTGISGMRDDAAGAGFSSEADAVETTDTARLWPAQWTCPSCASTANGATKAMIARTITAIERTISLSQPMPIAVLDPGCRGGVAPGT